MEWCVFRHNFNTHQIEKYNVFNHGGFNSDVQKLLNGEKVFAQGDTFSEKLHSIAMYYFWSKCEHEVVITSWPPRITEDELMRLENAFEQRENNWGPRLVSMDIRPTVGEKIDIYDQLMLNWDAFVKYVQETSSKESPS